MNVFLGAELYGVAQKYWFELRKEFSPKLNSLREKNYGDELKSIGIITIILPDYFFNDGGYPERRLFKRKTKEADIRLRINYYQFIHANVEERRTIYINHILESINTLRDKVSRSYQFDQFVKDVNICLTEGNQGTVMKTGDG